MLFEAAKRRRYNGLRPYIILRRIVQAVSDE